MESRLTYEGPLKAAAGVSEKHTLRRDFHEQLRVLWKQVPLSEYSSLLSSPPLEGEVSIIQDPGPYKFAPLVWERLYLIC